MVTKSKIQIRREHAQSMKKKRLQNWHSHNNKKAKLSPHAQHVVGQFVLKKSWKWTNERSSFLPMQCALFIINIVSCYDSLKFTVCLTLVVGVLCIFRRGQQATYYRLFLLSVYFYKNLFKLIKQILLTPTPPNLAVLSGPSVMEQALT